MTQIEYVIGDCTRPIKQGKCVIAHICNNQGAWGAGFVLALSKKWPKTKIEYQKWSKTNIDHDIYPLEFRLGEIQFVQIDNNISVCNMVAQDGFPHAGHPVAVSYKHLEECLGLLSKFARIYKTSIHMPRIGCGIGGGDWTVVEQIISYTLLVSDIKVYVYDLPQK